jgi:poly-gamma-glutamate capsule biosynthesis protein CapA/YwtB (metallophosphatase superfamily)
VRQVAPFLVAICALLLGAPGPASAPEWPPEIMITGDILLAGQAEQLIGEQGFGAPFAGVADVLRRADLTIGNLECSLTTGGTPAVKTWTFRAHPDTAGALVDAGYDLVTLANNHSMDYGAEALIETMSALRRCGIHHVGAGEDLASARRHLVVEAGTPPVRVAVLGYSNIRPTDFYASEDRPGTNPARLSTIADDVAAARCVADSVIVLFHWGDELSTAPSERQRRFAHAAADAGADLVIGHHPHVLQGFELRGRSLIAYSLGNFLFPSRGQTRRSMMVRYVPARDGPAQVEIIPCIIDGFRPRVASSKERAAILRHLRALSKELGSELPDEEGAVRIPPRPRLS